MYSLKLVVDDYYGKTGSDSSQQASYWYDGDKDVLERRLDDHYLDLPQKMNDEREDDQDNQSSPDDDSDASDENYEIVSADCNAIFECRDAYDCKFFDKRALLESNRLEFCLNRIRDE